jgi:hypothetical protein
LSEKLGAPVELPVLVGLGRGVAPLVVMGNAGSSRFMFDCFGTRTSFNSGFLLFPFRLPPVLSLVNPPGILPAASLARFRLVGAGIL